MSILFCSVHYADVDEYPRIIPTTSHVYIDLIYPTCQRSSLDLFVSISSILDCAAFNTEYTIGPSHVSNRPKVIPYKSDGSGR